MQNKPGLQVPNYVFGTHFILLLIKLSTVCGTIGQHAQRKHKDNSENN